MISVDKKILELKEKNEIPEETTALDLMQNLDYEQMNLLKQSYNEPFAKYLKLSPQDCSKLLHSFASADQFDIDMTTTIQQLLLEQLEKA